APRGDRVPRPRGRRRVPGDGRDAHPPQVQAARAARSERDRGAGRGGRGASARARGAAARVRAREGPRHVVGGARGGASAPLESPGGRLATARGGPARGPVGPPARAGDAAPDRGAAPQDAPRDRAQPDRKSTRLNSSHDQISYAVFCLKKKKKKYTRINYLRIT